jgi:hypothetical protein
MRPRGRCGCAGVARSDCRSGDSGLVVAIDIGTTGVKAAAVQAAAMTHTYAEREYPTGRSRPGWLVQDPEAVVEAACESGSRGDRCGRRLPVGGSGELPPGPTGRRKRGDPGSRSVVDSTGTLVFEEPFDAPAEAVGQRGDVETGASPPSTAKARTRRASRTAGARPTSTAAAGRATAGTTAAGCRSAACRPARRRHRAERRSPRGPVPCRGPRKHTAVRTGPAQEMALPMSSRCRRRSRARSTTLTSSPAQSTADPIATHASH